MGRLTADPEITSTTGGTNVANYTLAVDRRIYKEGQQKTDFFKCVSFGKQADFVQNYLKKGVKIVLAGEMRLDLVQKDGKNVVYPKVSVSEIEFAESKKSESGGEQKPDQTFLNVPEGLVEELPFE